MEFQIPLTGYPSLTAYEDQTGQPGASVTWRQDTPPFGSLIYGYVRKGLRASKVWKRSVKGVFTGWSKTTPGAARITPYLEEHDGQVTVQPTVEVVRYREFPTVFPLMTPDNQLQYTEPDSDLIDPIDYSQYPVYESNCSYDEYYQPCEDEIEAVLGHHNQLEDETEYQTAWNGMIRWFSESQLADCTLSWKNTEM